MQAKRLVSLLAAVSMGLGSVSAFAQDHGRSGQQRHDQHDQRANQQRHDQRANQQRHDERAMGNRGNDHDRDNDRNYGRDNGRDSHGYYYGARGPEWHRGGHLPPQYRSKQYVVNDWRGHHLSAPPRGYNWVQVGNDYVLAAIATGLIAQLLLNHS